MKWAGDLDLYVLLDLHGGPGSQDGQDDSVHAGPINCDIDALVGARCRLRAGRLEFQDRVSGQWREFTADMKAFAQATRLNAIEGVDFVFDVARQSWEAASEAISNGLERIDNKLEQAKEKAALARAEREAAAIAAAEEQASSSSNNSYQAEAPRQQPVRVPQYNAAPQPKYD